ncbi:jg16542 [Pararge aegeria aegeria]|uniref:Jg16542 protein n=1 Tax=Pararge aegeria aegeria TaxID=348720 RepID=A0A8S4SQ32_9NEOP|nr:jg16542 [Pararge aegeria aegeria]
MEAVPSGQDFDFSFGGYNNVLRAVLKKPRRCSASEMFADARVDDFYAIIRKRAASMMSRLVSSTNTLLSTLACRLDSSLWGCSDGVHTR